MGAGGPAAYSEQGSNCLQWAYGSRGPAAYSGYMGAGDPAAYSEQGVQLLTVGIWEQGSSCL